MRSGNLREVWRAHHYVLQCPQIFSDAPMSLTLIIVSDTLSTLWIFSGVIILQVCIFFRSEYFSFCINIFRRIFSLPYFRSDSNFSFTPTVSVAFKGYDILANQVILVTLVVKAYLYPKKFLPWKTISRQIVLEELPQTWNMGTEYDNLDFIVLRNGGWRVFSII